MGVEALFRTVIQVYEGVSHTARHIHINYGHEIEDGIRHIQSYLKPDGSINPRYSTPGTLLIASSRSQRGYVIICAIRIVYYAFSI